MRCYPGWPLSPPPAIFTPHWEQLQNGTLHLLPILWNPFQSLLQAHQSQAWMIIPIPHESYPLPSPFPQDLVTQAQSFWLNIWHVDPLNTSAPTVPIIIAPPADEPPPAIPTTNALNFIAPTVSSVVTPESSVPRPRPQPMTPSWTPPGISLITRSTMEIGVLEMELQDYEEGNITDVWDSPSFSSLLSSPPSHSLWDMITNDKGIFSEIWDQFIGGNVLSITF